MTRAWPALVLLAMAAPGAHAQARGPAYAAAAAASAQGRHLSNVQKLERRFLQITAANMRFSADASRLAEARSSNPALKEIARSVLARQKALQPEVLRLLQARGMAMPIPTNEHSKLLKQLGKLNGARFDRLYHDGVLLRTAQADLENFERVAAPQVEDPVLKAWVEREVPVLRAQLDRVSRAVPAGTVRGQRAAAS